MEKRPSDPTSQELLKLHIGALDLPSPIQNALEVAGVRRIGDLVNLREVDLLGLPHGGWLLHDVRASLSKKGLMLRAADEQPSQSAGVETQRPSAALQQPSISFDEAGPELRAKLSLCIRELGSPMEVLKAFRSVGIEHI